MYQKKTTVITYPLRKCDNRTEAYKQLAAVCTTNAVAEYVQAERIRKRSSEVMEESSRMIYLLKELMSCIACGLNDEAVRIMLSEVVNEYAKAPHTAKKTTDNVRKAFSEADTRSKKIQLVQDMLNASYRRESRARSDNGLAEKAIKELMEYFDSDTFVMYTFGRIDRSEMLSRLNELAGWDEDADVKIELTEEGIY